MCTVLISNYLTKCGAFSWGIINDLRMQILNAFFAFSPLVVKLWIDWMSYNKDEVILSNTKLIYKVCKAI